VTAVLRDLSPTQIDAAVAAMTAFNRAAHERAETEWADTPW
jgi:hypothetical protein